MSLSKIADQVRDIPLDEVLERYGFEFKVEGRTLRVHTEEHNIVVTGNQWFDNKANIGGGGAIDLVMHIGGMDFAGACRFLATQFQPLAASQTALSFPSSIRKQSPPKKKPFEELAAVYAVRDDSNWPVARAYLVDKRQINTEIVDELHAAGLIYTNNHRPNPSLVFLHRDINGNIRGATLRDTEHQSAFRPCLGNKLTAWFTVGDLAKAERIVAVESPIDALSYHSIFACSGSSLAVVSCSGAIVPQELMYQVHERRQAFVVALDNDPAGKRGWLKAWNETLDWTGFKLSVECPNHKDWNEDLVAVRQHLHRPKSQKSASLKL